MTMRRLTHALAASVAALVLLVPARVGAQASVVTLLGYQTKVPVGWTPRTPSSTMRLAEYVVPSKDGGVGAEVIVYFFGKGQGGTVESNLTRWKGQFSTPDGSPVPETVTHDSATGFPITFAQYKGTYARGIGAGSPADQAKPGQELLAAVAETPRGTLFIQLFGPIANVDAEHGAFVAFVKGLEDASARKS